MTDARLHTRTPGFALHTCVSVSCVTCQEPFGDDDIGVVHFDSVDAASEALADTAWWLTTDGPQCPHCAATQACAESGHAWGAWGPCRCGCTEGEPRIRSHTEPRLWRLCESCDRTENKPA